MITIERLGEQADNRDIYIADTEAELLVAKPSTKRADGHALDTGRMWHWTARQRAWKPAGGVVDASGDTVIEGSLVARGVEVSVSDLATGYDYTKMTQISVRVDGTGDFLTIQEAINSVVDASAGNQYVVNVFDDFAITDLTKLYLFSTPTQKFAGGSSVSAFISLVILKDFVHLRGMGGMRKLSVVSPTNLTAASYRYIQTLFVQGNTSVDNFVVSIKGGRYAIHQDNGQLSNSPDIDALSVRRNIRAIHLGNATEDGYPAGAWTSTCAEANGTASGMRQVYDNVEWESVNDVPFYWHGNKGFAAPTYHKFVNCRGIRRKAGLLGTISFGYNDLGSGQKATIEMVGCDFSNFKLSQTIYSTETIRGAADLHENLGAYLIGNSNSPMAVIEDYRNCMIFSPWTTGQSVAVIGGSAYNDIWGGVATYYAGASNYRGTIWGRKLIQAPGLALGNSQIFTLAYRLGNCAASPKTLIVNVNGVDHTITFDKNYMTADGSAYSYNTVPYLTDASIVADINTASAFSCSIRSAIQWLTPTDCAIQVYNNTSLKFRLGHSLVRDYASGWGCYRLAQAGEYADVVCLRPTGQGESGLALLIKRGLVPCYASSMGIGATVTPGAYYKCAADGALVVTAVKSEASFVAVDNTYLTAINP